MHPPCDLKLDMDFTKYLARRRVHRAVAATKAHTHFRLDQGGSITSIETLCPGTFTHTLSPVYFPHVLRGEPHSFPATFFAARHTCVSTATTEKASELYTRPG